jgi:hypothetical protein
VPIPKSNLGFDFNIARKSIYKEIIRVCGLDSQHAILAEPEVQNEPRPTKPYFSFKFTTPASKFGDDSKDPVLDNQGNPTTVVNSGGVRRMSVSFDCYGNTHEEAYNYMTAWQCGLDREDVQENLRRVGIAVWTIGNVADLSQLLNTGYEGRAHMDCTFGIAVNTQSDTGEIDTVPVQGTVDIGNSQENVSEVVT